MREFHSRVHELRHCVPETVRIPRRYIYKRAAEHTAGGRANLHLLAERCVVHRDSPHTHLQGHCLRFWWHLRDPIARFENREVDLHPASRGSIRRDGAFTGVSACHVDSFAPSCYACSRRNITQHPESASIDNKGLWLYIKWFLAPCTRAQ